METGFAANFAPALSASAARKSEAVAGLILRSAARSIGDLEGDFTCINCLQGTPFIGRTLGIFLLPTKPPASYIVESELALLNR